MFGNNPKRQPKVSDGSNLKVQKIFLTIQGEGPHAGVPAIFIRLGGCNLACKFCDTEFESFEEMKIEEIIENVTSLAHQTSVKLIVITGGEPFRQSINLLCHALLDLNFQVQIETNGTLYQEIPEKVQVVCSPKPNGYKYFKPRKELENHIIAYKFLVSHYHEGYKAIPEWEFGNIPVYVQPIDEIETEKNQNNSFLAIEIATKKNYIYSCQIHKIIGIE
ncbi:MAG: 7-carboxy-7-deazaguanine synthase QueE [Rickettsiaceae bacterium]|nr:7-carboxy-7-deazaguanine synthase QueE [Rickettsiaceae bacterium]